jgi:catechol 2,3-dioxygenase-like lactoylglutathione lyase family enzyme
MPTSSVAAVLFAKDHRRVAAFYTRALGMRCLGQDEHHSRLDCRGFELIVHRIPPPMADGIAIEQPPKRRVSGAIRLDYPVESLAASRVAARSLGGGIDDVPPEWAERDANFFFGYDPEGNQFGVREEP